MLVLTRRQNQKVLFPSLGIAVEVVEVSGKTVRLGIDAPREIKVIRDELNVEPTLQRQCFEAVDVQQKLDAANLAIHLAQNQLQSGLGGYAEEALQTAIECLQSLDESLKEQLEQVRDGVFASSVFESKPQFRTGPDVLIIGHESDVTERLLGQLESAGLNAKRIEKDFEAVQSVLNCGFHGPMIRMLASDDDAVTIKPLELVAGVASRFLDCQFALFENRKLAIWNAQELPGTILEEWGLTA